MSKKEAGIDVERLAQALPAWMVEHPLGQTEDELRAKIAANIAAEYARLAVDMLDEAVKR